MQFYVQRIFYDGMYPLKGDLKEVSPYRGYEAKIGRVDFIQLAFFSLR